LQFSWANADTALKNWRRVFFEVGIYVFKDQFRTEAFSGFCLYHEEFPIIYVNNTTTKTRQIFTLFHELAHLLFHTSGIDTPNDDYIEALPQKDRRIEVICNRLAARLLVPEDAFERAFAGRQPTEATASEIARQFNVSRESIYRKFLDRDLITRADYDAAVNRWNQQRKGPPGGDPYNTKIAYLGDEYITRAFQNFYQNQIDADQLADYLDIKPKNLTRLEEYISRRVS
jgi:Zn-dependent peptidase ImmA (M78 family)